LLPTPGQLRIKVPDTEEEKIRWLAVREAWAEFNRTGDARLSKEVGLFANIWKKHRARRESQYPVSPW